MKITAVEVYVLRAPDGGRPHWVSHFVVPAANELLVRLRTDAGIEGIGLATSYTPIEAAVHAVRSGICDLIVGADPLAPEALYRKLFSLTWQRLAHERGWSREALVRISAAVDIAAWDIVGKRAGLPLYRLFGGYRSVVPCYVTCAYYRDGKDLAELRDEMEMLKAQGHTGFKAKAGGASLACDLERPGAGARGDRRHQRPDGGCEPRLGPGDRHRGGAAAGAAPTPLAGGAGALGRRPPRAVAAVYQDLHTPVCGGERADQLRLPRPAGEQAIRILQFDCTMMGGFTEGRKLAALCELHHVQVAPHHDCFLHAHIVAASPAGCIVESFTDPERDPLQAELFEDPPRIAGGRLSLKEDPGLGLTLSDAALTRFGERIR